METSDKWSLAKVAQYSEGGRPPPQQSFQKKNEGQNVFKEILPLNLMGDESVSLSSSLAPVSLSLSFCFSWHSSSRTGFRMYWLMYVLPRVTYSTVTNSMLLLC